MDLKKLNRKEYYGLYVILFIVVCCLVGMLFPTKDKTVYSDFAKPLYEHDVPKDSVLLEKSEDSGEADGKAYSFACLILQSPLSQEELAAFYGDVSYAPAREGDEVSLRVLPVEGDSIEVVKKSKYYKEGRGNLWYVYLYSSEK